MKPAPFDYRRPDTLDEAIGLLLQYEGDAQPIAGGQSLMPMLAFRVVAPRLLVDINRIPELACILKHLSRCDCPSMCRPSLPCVQALLLQLDNLRAFLHHLFPFR